MNEQEFTQSLDEKQPPEKVNVFLQALWWENKGNWQKAHELIEHVDGLEASWVHAYLHRKEGDAWNADYWYRRAGKSRPSGTIAEEWQSLVNYFINKK